MKRLRVSRHRLSRHRLSRHRLSRRLIPLTILLLVSMACSLPNFGSLTQTPVATAVLAPSATPQPPQGANTSAPAEAGQIQAQAGNAQAAINLPPALVEVEPLPHSGIGPKTAPVFYFNQPMERASVEAAFKVQPEQAGRFEWLNDATVRYVPANAAVSQNGLNVTIETGAKAANGLPMSQPVQVNYPAAGPLRLAERLPAPDAKEVNPSSAVVVTFSQPVVNLGADPQSLPAAFTLDPAAPGRGEWVNTSTYIFYPEPALLGGATYTVRLNSALASTYGAALVSDSSLTWTFATAAPVLLSVTPSPGQPVPLDGALTLTFNQPMDTASVEADFSLIRPGGGPVAGKLTWNGTASEVTFKPDNLLERASSYTLALFGTARSQGGATLGRDFAATLNTVPQFAVTKTDPAAGQTLTSYSGYGTIALTFSSPVAAGQDYNRLVKLEPAVVSQSIYRHTDGSVLYLSGYFQPSTSYTLTISPDLRDRWGATLGVPFSFTFSSQPARPQLVIPIRQIGATAVFVPQNETNLPARGTNITRLALSRGRLSLPEFIQAQTSDTGLQNWEPKVNASWAALLYPTPDKSETVNIPLTQDGNTLEPGLYFLKIDTQPALEEGAYRQPEMLVVSPVQMVFKISNRQAFIWAVKLPENTPVADSAVTIYDPGMTPLGNCTTDAQGTCQVDLPAHSEPYRALFAVHGQPGDADFSLAVNHWSSGVSPWEFRVTYREESSQPKVYLYTDRPIYRPGQAVNFRVVVRAQDNGRYSAPPLNQVTVDVINPYNPVTGQVQTLTSLRLPLDPNGSASASYTLPADASLGNYTLHVQEDPFNDIYFTVAEYRKPEIDLQVKFTQADVLAGKDLQAQINARYFFGAPAGNLAVHWALYRSQMNPELPDGLQSSRLDTSWMLPADYRGLGSVDLFVLEGQAQTAPDGTLQLTIPGTQLREKMETALADPQQLRLEVTVTDESGLPVSSRSTIKMHPSPVYIGVRAEQWSGQSGEELTYTIRSVDWQGSPVADQPLSARFRKVTWTQQDANDPAAPPTYQPQYTEIGGTDFRTSQQGEARLAFTPSQPGNYMIEVTGENGAITQVLTWVGGQGSAPWPNLPNQRIELRSDKSKYQSGQTAHIFIPNPFEGGALALITVERAKVMRSQVVPIQGASYDLQLPLSDADAPNIYVSVTLLGRTNGRPDFRMGYLDLTVPPEAQILQVEVQTSPQQPQPGGDLTVFIRAKDPQGKPVQGEFSLALVDKAVLALADPNTPSMLEAFYGHQPLGVRSSLSLAVYAGRMIYYAPGRGGGSGGGDETFPVRTKFADTAYWNGALQTDVTGVAQATFKLPDNLTTWRADVRGLTNDTRVGQTEADLVVSKPLLIRPVSPRFVVAGDHLEMAAIVNNNTQEAQQGSVRMEGSGLTLDDPNQAAQPLTIGPGERKRVTWWATVQDVEALDLTFSVEAGSNRDAARPEQGLIPVRRYAAPQTFGTAGLLNEAGERLELVSLPRSFQPTGGELRVEVSPSLSAAVVEGLKAMDAFPYDFTEPILSRLLPNLATYQALKDLNLQDPVLRGDLETAINDSAGRLMRSQNQDGGWGWAAGYPSDLYISSYVLYGLSRAAQSVMLMDGQTLQKAQDYLAGKLADPAVDTPGWQLDRLAFQYFALYQSGRTDFNLDPLYQFRDKLSPWGKALLALALQTQQPGDQRARTLVSELAAAANRSATGASWQDPNPSWHNWSSSGFTTAVVAYALATFDPASPVLTDAVRYLMLNRQPGGAWSSSYETAWVLLAMVQTVRATGDLQANYTYSARLNDSPLLDGKVENPTQAIKPANSTVPLAKLNADAPNALVFQRGAGSGRLYYRAYLEVGRPAQDAPAIERGLSLSREYILAGQDCRKVTCAPLDSVELNSSQPVLVHLTLTLPQDMYYMVVEDTIPAGMEVLNPRLKTSQQNTVPSDQPGETTGETPAPPFDPADPFGQGWGWWLFKDPQVYDDHVRWVVDYLPAGTYQLTYRLTPYMAGEFRVIPARAWQYYFPEVEGASKGSVFKVR